MLSFFFARGQKSHSLQMLQHEKCDYDVLIDASSGDRAVPLIQHTLKSGRRVVSANKTPIATDFKALMAYPNIVKRFRYSATVCGGLPVLNVGMKEFPAAHYHCVQGVFNSTSNYVLDECAKGRTLEDALREAQERGIAEGSELRGGKTVDNLADLVRNDNDLNGYDTANKLCIIVNAILDQECSTKDIPRTGITPEIINEPLKDNHVLRLLAKAQWNGQTQRYDLSVEPEQVLASSNLGRCGDTSMGIEFRTDIFENIYMTTDEKGVYPTAAAVLRDIKYVCEDL